MVVALAILLVCLAMLLIYALVRTAERDLGRGKDLIHGRSSKNN